MYLQYRNRIKGLKCSMTGTHDNSNKWDIKRMEKKSLF